MIRSDFCVESGFTQNNGSISTKTGSLEVICNETSSAAPAANNKSTVTLSSYLPLRNTFLRYMSREAMDDFSNSSKYNPIISFM